MKNLIILSVLLLLAVSGYAQSISGSLNTDYAKAMPPVPAAFKAVDNTVKDYTAVENKIVGITADDITSGIPKADAEIEQASTFKPLPAPANEVLVRVDQGGDINNTGINTGTWKPVNDNSKVNLVPAVPANDLNIPFENVPKQEENTVPEKAGPAL